MLAISVAGVSTYLLRSFSGEENITELQKEAATQRLVLVAAKPIRPGEAILGGFLRWQGWAKDSLNEKFIVVDTEDEGEKRIKDFTGGIARSLINQGEPILADKIFKSEKPGFMAGMLDSGMRAVSFSVTPQTASAGFILPGNRVDVLMTHAIKWKKGKKSKKEQEKSDSSTLGKELAENETRLTETILRDVKVLAINQAVDVVEGNSLPATTVTIEATPKQVEQLFTARSIGKLSMVLRSLKTPDEADSELGYTVDSDVSPFLREYSKARRMARRIRAKKEIKQPDMGSMEKPPLGDEEPKSSGLKIFRGTGGGGKAGK